MKAKIKRVAGGILLESDQPLFTDLADGTEVEISVAGDTFVITPTFRTSAEKILDRHSGLFRRLADS